MARGLQPNKVSAYGFTRLPVSSVASGPSVVASLRSFQTTRGPSAPAGNTAEHTTPFSMLLDANSPSVDSKPAPSADRPACADARPDRNPPATNDQPADAAPPATPKSDSAPDARCGKADGNTGTDGKTADDSKDTGDNKDGNAAVTGDASAADQNSTDPVGSCTQVLSAQIVTGPAIAPFAPATDATPDQSANSSDTACVAPAASPPVIPAALNAALDGTTPVAPATTAQITPDGQSGDAGNPAQAATAGTPAAKPANIPAAVTSAASTAATDTIVPTDDGASTEAGSDAAPATSATVTTTANEPAKKSALAGATTPAPPAENSTPVNETAPASPATSTAYAKPILKAAAAEAGKSETGKAGDAKDPAQAKLGDGKFTQVDSANTNANPPVTGANGQPAKNDGTSFESETANGHAHHTAAEQISAIAPKPESSNQIADLAVTRASIDAAPASNATVQVPQTIAPALAVAAPAIVAVAAIPLAAVPVEIATRAKDGINRFEIRLDPPELGRIDVRLDIDRSGHVTSRLMVERPETLDLLRRDAPQIERALQDAGLKTSDQGMQFSLRDQTFADQNESLPSTANLVLPQDDFAPLEAMRQGYGRLLGLGGGIDIRV